MSFLKLVQLRMKEKKLKPTLLHPLRPWQGPHSNNKDALNGAPSVASFFQGTQTFKFQAY